MNINDDFCEMAKPAERVTPVHPKNILAPIDSDASGAEEIDYAIRLAEHYDANLWLMPITKQLGIAADVRPLSSYVHNSWSHQTQVQIWDWCCRRASVTIVLFPYPLVAAIARSRSCG